MSKRLLKTKERMLDRRRLSEAWMRWHAMTWDQEMQRPLTVPENLEEYLVEMLPDLKKHFTSKWSGNHHTSNCCSKGILIIMNNELLCHPFRKFIQVAVIAFYFDPNHFFNFHETQMNSVCISKKTCIKVIL